MKIALGTHRFQRAVVGERRIDRNHTFPESSHLSLAIIACVHAHSAPITLRASDGSGAYDCTLEAMRTQGFYGDNVSREITRIMSLPGYIRNKGKVAINLPLLLLWLRDTHLLRR
jgi:hypothetical protein